MNAFRSGLSEPTMNRLHPEAVKACKNIYNSYRNGKDVRWVDHINTAITKATGRTIDHYRILDVVCAHLGVCHSLVLADDRHAHLVWARNLTGLLLYEFHTTNKSEINRLMRKKHSWSWWAIKTAKDWIATYPNGYGRDYETIKAKLEQ